ncbi:MAG TPA: hypothetical protein VM368_06475 [Flavisolibacter sp.]|nr:hypothetical protein [Flavisolibacter sp.]
MITVVAFSLLRFEFPLDIQLTWITKVFKEFALGDIGLPRLEAGNDRVRQLYK